MACPSEDLLVAFLDGRLAPELSEGFHGHIEGCADCGDLVALLARSLPGAAPAAPVPTAGDFIGDYKIETVLGQGGMGIVFRAFDTALQRPVALKFVSPRLAGDSLAAARFQREARAASALLHPGIATVFQLGQRDGYSFIVMAYYDGETLAERLQRGPLDGAEAARVVSLLLDALAAAHRAGIIHRDLKPSNIMLTREGGVVLLDFGVAKLHDAAGDPSRGADREWEASGEADNPLTAAGSVVGTRAYMSPEQAAGDTVDLRADLYATGAILHHALVGRLPRASQPDDGHDSKAPRKLLAIAKKAMAGLPAQRYGSAEEMLADARRFVDGSPVSALRPSPWERVRRQVEQHRLRAVVILAVALASLSGMVIAARRHHSRAELVATRQRADVEIAALERRLPNEVDPIVVDRLAVALEDMTQQARRAAEKLGDAHPRLAAAPPDERLDREIRDILRSVGDEPYAIPPSFRARVDRHLAAIEGSTDRDEVARRRRGVWKPICDSLDRLGLPEPFRYIPFVESVFDPEAVSQRGAAGLWQLLAENARSHGLRVDPVLDERLDPVRSSQAAARFLAELMVEFGDGAPLLALMSYNLGPDRARKLLHDVVARRDGWRGTQRSFWYLLRTGRLPPASVSYVARIVAAAVFDLRPTGWAR